MRVYMNIYILTCRRAYIDTYVDIFCNFVVSRVYCNSSKFVYNFDTLLLINASQILKVC